ncbi:hypothetical protein JCM8097_004818 [Rhodosporidiobolus ruineniae]
MPGRVSSWFRKHFVPAPPSPSPSPSPAGSSPSTSRPPTAYGAPIVNVRSHHPPSGNTVADRPVTQPRRRRRRRRTTSPVGLPLYSKDPGEEEMSLFKSEIDLTMDHYTPAEGEEDEEDEGESSGSEDEDEDDGTSRGRPSTQRERPSFDASTIDTGAGASRRSSLMPPSPTAHLAPPSALGIGGVQNRPRSASAPLAHLTGSPLSSTPPLGGGPYLYPLARFVSHSPGSSSPFASRTGLIDLPPDGLEAGSSPSPPPSSPPISLHTRTWAHRPSRSSPINSLSPPSPSSSPAASSLGHGRPRSSTLQRMFQSRNASQLSLSSPGVGEGGRSPYGQGVAGGAGGSTARLASSSTASVSTQSISAPLPNSFVHSSFIFPRSGPTPQQVAFISSRESLGAYGYGAGVARDAGFHEPPTFDAATSQADLTLGLGGGLSPPRPSVEVVRGRGRSGSSASRMSSSPLARVETLTPPTSRPSTPPPAPVSPPVAAAVAAAPQPRTEEDEEKSPSATTSTRSPPALSLNLNLSALPSLPTFSTPSPSTLSPSPSTPSGLAQSFALHRRSSTTASSPPPAIITLAPTPTASAAPSPLLPSAEAFPPPLPNAPAEFPLTTTSTPTGFGSAEDTPVAFSGRSPAVSSMSGMTIRAALVDGGLRPEEQKEEGEKKAEEVKVVA